MKGLDLVKEETVCISSKKWAKDYFKKYWPDESLDKDQHAYCIYTVQHSHVEVVHFEWGDSVLEEPALHDDFAEYLNKFEPTTFKDYIFLLDWYTSTKKVSLNLSNLDVDASRYLNENLEDAIKGFHRYRSKVAEAIESHLEDTKGLILWHHQLESIISIFVDSGKEVQSLRKGFNAKNPEAIDALDKFCIDNTTPLLDFIRERLVWINGTTTNPNTHGAYVLYKAMVS